MKTQNLNSRKLSKLFEILITNESEGEPQEFEENTSEWEDKYNFNMHIEVDGQENILGVKYNLEVNINGKLFYNTWKFWKSIWKLV